MSKDRSIGNTIADITIYTVLGLLALSIIFPFYNMLILSFSTFEDAARAGFMLFPRALTLENYQRIFSDAQLISAIIVSVRNVLFGVAMAMVMTVFASYVLSRRNLPGRKILFYFVIFTMFFSAGLIPWYLVMVNLGFVNNIWVMTVPNALSVFNMILMRNYFMSLPDSLDESARLDGAGEFIIMWRIIVPLSKPIMATVALFYAVGFWNEWWNAMLFLQDRSMTPLALLLRRLVIENTVAFGDVMGHAARATAQGPVHSRSLELATVTVATVPILLVYPFLQRYFTKGIMLGAIKA
ncbi:MAG: carbohydrate ABC transporter permease [Defluviitaleaceae bacterium]|nr:carbohydrate ABC transporter permease [Defluviitaleaceae bacterium]